MFMIIRTARPTLSKDGTQAIKVSPSEEIRKNLAWVFARGNHASNEHTGRQSTILRK